MTMKYIHFYKFIVTIFCVIIAQTIYAVPPDCPATLTANLTQDLDFGDYVGTNGGTITIDTAGVRTETGGVFLVGGAVFAATYVFSNSDSRCLNRWIKITAIPTSITISGPASMTVNNFTTSAAADGDKFKISTTDTVTIGADLITNNAQVQGPYTGNFTVDFNY